ncbi:MULTISPECIES: hypothetical protein [Thalassospira]|uniref:hypothetical protein n=1 Tax=Thalassospira TaxID=168934 RepID=UPI000AC88FCF|nr:MULTISPECIES: hypothetical protein [Thalassospira]
MAIQPELPFLRALLWQGNRERRLSEQEMLNAYERGWRFHDILAELTVDELEFIEALASSHGSWLEVECRKLITKRNEHKRKGAFLNGHKPADIKTVVSALSRRFMQDHSLGLSGRTSLYASIVGFAAPDEVRLTLVNPPENIKAFRDEVFRAGPKVLFECAKSEPFVFGQCYFNQSGGWFSVRPSVKAPGIKVFVLYDLGGKALEVGSYKENLGKTLPSVALNDEFASSLVDLFEGTFSGELMRDVMEQVVFFAACASDLEGVIDQIKTQGLRREQFESFLPRLLEETADVASLVPLYSRGAGKLNALLERL